MNRYVTFTFDDGLIDSAKLVNELKIPATIYIVLGWVLKEIKIKDSFNCDLNHGTIEDWKGLNLDIGCHTYDHDKNFNEHLSFKKYSRLFFGPKNLSTPYGIKYYPKLYDSCKIGFYGEFYNSFTKENIKQINSINPCFDLDKETLKSVILNCPDQKWIVLTFHGINEGWMPITYEDLKFWIDFFKQNNFTFLTITEALKKTCKKYLL